MAKKLLLFFLFISILGACSQQDTEETEISLEDVETALTEQGFVLEIADLPSENVFIQELNGVSPNVYYLEDNSLSIYVFPSASDRGKGIKRFEEITATIDLVKHKAYGINNILVFYVSDDEKVQKRLFETLQILESPK